MIALLVTIWLLIGVVSAIIIEIHLDGGTVIRIKDIPFILLYSLFGGLLFLAMVYLLLEKVEWKELKWIRSYMNWWNRTGNKVIFRCK